MNPLAGLPLDYLIGADEAPPVPGHVVEVGYDTPAPAGSIGYVNLFDEKKSGQFKPYREDTETAKQYDEGVPDASGAGFALNLRQQLEARHAQGCMVVELDNPDAYSVMDNLRALDLAASYGFQTVAKNPQAIDGDPTPYLAHPSVIGVIIEKDDEATLAKIHAMRIKAGKPDLPLRFVSFGDGNPWAVGIAVEARDGRYADVGVTYSADGEYGSVKHILLPNGGSSGATEPVKPAIPAPPMPASGAAIVAKARSYIGRFHDGPDVPMLAREIGKIFPEFATYCRQAANDMPWCGDWLGYLFAQFGIRPPPIQKNGNGFFFVDNWLGFGTEVPPSQRQPGDVQIYLGSPHHVNIYAGGGKSIGGNQSDAVTEGTYRMPDAVRRPPGASASPVANPPQIAQTGRLAACMPRVLAHEGGNDNNPRDPGGRTSRGILQREWNVWRQSHSGLPSDVFQAPQDQVLAIYQQKYWDVLHCDALPVGVDYCVFDFGVNSGNSRSAKFLQKIVGTDQDGEIGPLTIAAVASKDPVAVINQLCDDRMTFLQGLSTWGTFKNGWTTRVKDVRRDALADAASGGPAPIPQPQPIPQPGPIPLPQPIPQPADWAVAIAALESRFNAQLAELSALIRQAPASTTAHPLGEINWAKVAPAIDSIWWVIRLGLNRGAPAPAPTGTSTNTKLLGGGGIAALITGALAWFGQIDPNMLAAIGTGAAAAIGAGGLGKISERKTP